MMTPQRNECAGGVSIVRASRFTRVRSTIAVFFAVVCFGCGAEEAPPPPISVELTVAIAAPGEIDPASTVHLSVHHAWTGTGELRYPLEIVEGFETSLGSSTFSFEYPAEGGDGLVVYAWVDSDGDGINCTPTERGDLADLAEVEEFPSEQVSVSLLLVSASLFLDAPCAGPDWFFPGPEPEADEPPEDATETVASPEL